VKSNVNVVKMPGDCPFNDSWTLSDQYTHWISRTKNIHQTRQTLGIKVRDLMAAWQKVLEN